MKRTPLAFLTASLLFLSLVHSHTVQATTILYEATDLPDNNPGEDLWQFTYHVSDHTFDTDHGVTIYFDHELYGDIENPQPPNGDVNLIVWQPDKAIPDDGAYDALSLADGNPLPGPFTVKFVWLGNGTPGPQPFDIYDPNFDTSETGQTAPKPNVEEMPVFEVLKAKIQKNKKGGYKAKIKGTLEMTNTNEDATKELVVRIGAAYQEAISAIENKTTWSYKRDKGAKGGIKKLSIKWDKKTDPTRKAKKFSIATDTADIFSQSLIGVGHIDVTISLRVNLNDGSSEEGSKTINMTEKKGKLSFKATR